jgi:hypothetical protein
MTDSPARKRDGVAAVVWRATARGFSALRSAAILLAFAAFAALSPGVIP